MLSSISKNNCKPMLYSLINCLAIFMLKYIHNAHIILKVFKSLCPHNLFKPSPFFNSHSPSMDDPCTYILWPILKSILLITFNHILLCWLVASIKCILLHALFLYLILLSILSIFILLLYFIIFYAYLHNLVLVIIHYRNLHNYFMLEIIYCNIYENYYLTLILTHN